MSKTEQAIFKNGSTTYYWSSKFFPKGVRDDVFKLYSFVRVVDDYVDAIPQNTSDFESLVKRWQACKRQLIARKMPSVSGSKVEDIALKNMCYVVYRYDCDVAWVDAFLHSMKLDTTNKSYKKMDDSLEYVYGSAEVIGLFMAKLLQLPIAPYEYARMQGRAMQWINFIRDIAEDIELGRCYFPSAALKEHGLKNLTEAEARKQPKAFRAFVGEQLAHYESWQAEANKGFEYIPRRSRVAVRTAVDMYNWTAEQIKKDPFIVYRKKVKPTKKQVITQAAKNAFIG